MGAFAGDCQPGWFAAVQDYGAMPMNAAAMVKRKLEMGLPRDCAGNVL